MKKTVYKKFSLWQSEDEEKWLNEMSAKGWQIEKIGVLRYQFQECKPNEYLYKLELLENDANDPESRKYINFLNEAGIDVVGTCKNWLYLRKKFADGPFDQANSPLSKLTYAMRLYFSLEKVRNIFIFVLAFFMLISQIAARTDYTSSFFDFLQGFANGIAMGSAVLLICCSPYYNKLRKHMRDYIKEMRINE